MARPRKEDAEIEALDDVEPGETVTDSWPTIVQVMQQTRKSRSWVHKQISAGFFHPKTVNNKLRFPPEEIEPYVSDVEDITTVPAAQVIQASASLTEQAEAHNEALFKLMSTAWKDVLEVQTTIIKQQQEQIISQMVKLQEQAELAEKMRTEEHERKLDEMRFERESRMKERALESLKSLSPMIMAYVAQKYPDMGPAIRGMVNAQPQARPDTDKMLNLAEGLLTIFRAMPDDKFALLKDGLGAEAFEVLSDIRASISMKGN